MKYIPAMVFLLGGLIIAIVGVSMALKPVADLYQSAMDDPLAESAEGEEVRDDMLIGVAVGAVGVVPLTIGTVMYKRARKRRA